MVLGSATQGRRAAPSTEGPATRCSARTHLAHEAENWKQKVEERNEGWDEDDETWEHAGESDDD